ncbi:hypothetical protein FRC03_000184 [Tulasnella sp. 419]|nr:hypothetical protein FRC03_000184 [Tulasnella sp. 419]
MCDAISSSHTIVRDGISADVSIERPKTLTSSQGSEEIAKALDAERNISSNVKGLDSAVSEIGQHAQSCSREDAVATQLLAGSQEQLKCLTMVCTYLEKFVRLEGYDGGLPPKKFSGLDNPLSSSSDEVTEAMSKLFHSWTIAVRSVVRASQMVSSTSFDLSGCGLFIDACGSFHSSILKFALHLESIDIKTLSLDQLLSPNEEEDGLKMLCAKLGASSRDLQDNAAKLSIVAKRMKVKSSVSIMDASNGLGALSYALERYSAFLDKLPQLSPLNQKREFHEQTRKLIKRLEDVEQLLTVLFDRAIPLLSRRMELHFWVLGAVSAMAGFIIPLPAEALNKLSDPWGHPTPLEGLKNGYSIDDGDKTYVDIRNIIANSSAAVSFTCEFIAIVSAPIILYLFYHHYSLLPKTIDNREYLPPSDYLLNLPAIFMISGLFAYFASLILPLYSSFIEFVILGVMMFASLTFLGWRAWNWFSVARVIENHELRLHHANRKHKSENKIV